MVQSFAFLAPFARGSLFQWVEFRGYRLGGEGLHLADGDLVEAFEAVALGQAHVDELGVHALNVREDEELFDGGIFAHVAVEFGVGIAPLPCCLSEEGDV